MVEAGILEDPERYELLEGELLEMPPIGPDHVNATNMLTERLVLAYAGLATVSVGNPISRDRFHAPQPDFSVLGGLPGSLGRRLPTGADTLLAIEVSNSTLKRDRIKLRDCAGTNVPVVWLLDLPARRLEEHSDPRDGEYRQTRVYLDHDEIALPGVDVRWIVGELFPPA